ncbi:MAG: hypothetical protein WCL50_07825 [Spirochaetota bacterium]
MTAKGSYIIVGENIHCTRIRLISGKFIERDVSGRSFLVFKDGPAKGLLPVPEAFTRSDDWQAGKIRHVACAIHQGMKGSPEEREAGKNYLRAMAREQEAAGAWFLDLNVDEYSMDIGEKVAAMEWTAAIVQGATAIPLSVDSSEPKILEAGLKACDKSKASPWSTPCPSSAPPSSQ